ncbi:GNAT family N-acetyltransferase [Micrococcaceae bacterium Sec5.7]
MTNPLGLDDLLGLDQLEVLMDAAWPADERHDTAEWVLRSASGVTQRANSVWPRHEAADRVAAAREAALWYRKRRLPVIYQVLDDARHGSLNAMLDGLGFTRQSETLIMTRAIAAVYDEVTAAQADVPAVEILDQPSAEWLSLWWSVDGRGGDPELKIARRILTGCPSLYALVRYDDGAVAAVGRLALVDGHGGIYCMATRPENRRNGYARQVLEALLDQGRSAGVNSFWLLVMDSNPGARMLYSQAGFVEAGRYSYRQERPKRSLNGC